jgi:hypothetical protein
MDLFLRIFEIWITAGLTAICVLALSVPLTIALTSVAKRVWLAQRTSDAARRWGGGQWHRAPPPFSGVSIRLDGGGE